MLLLGQDHWFIKKVICWRAAASVAWSVLLLPAFTAAFVLLSRFSFFHPIQWILGSFSFIYASYVIFSIVFLCLVVLSIGFFSLQFYTVVPSIPCTRIALLGKVLHPHQLFHSFSHCVMGIFVFWCAAVMIGGRYQALIIPCSAENSFESIHMCLNEYHLFFLLAGGFLGFIYSLLYVVNNMNYVSFPCIQQYKYLRVKGAFPLVIKHSAIQALYSVRNFIIVYYFLGYIPRAWFCTAMNHKRDSSAPSLDSLAGLLDFSFIYHLWLSGTFLLMLWYTTWLLFKIYITEVVCFPVQTAFSEKVNECLPKVLNSKQPPVLKYLALQDFALLSQHSASRRHEVFSLSQPGGHPHNWSTLSGECLSLLNNLTHKLIAYQEAIASNGRVKQQPIDGDNRSSLSRSSVTGSSSVEDSPPWQEQSTTSSQTNRGSSSVFKPSLSSLKSPLTAPFSPDMNSPFGSPALKRLTASIDPGSPWYGSVQSPHLIRRGPKLWTSSTDSPLNGRSQRDIPVLPCTSPGPQKSNFLTVWLQNGFDQVKTFLAKRVLVMYLFNKLPEASSQALFADSQAHIWALEGLSHLVAASYFEDKFGVVQTTLPDILSSMLNLQKAVDKHFKLPHASSKPMRTSGSLVDASYKTLRFALRAALKTAIYRITTTFGDHLTAVQMSEEHRKRLQLFLDYKE
ncbi:nucleoporin NDC1 [Polypterus senegalus]|uniref:nucleoporin NDC1 n=1 Tax=Polypterus senegalus TaxID=55291 RepID=UPI0019657233|nr:nucleoporin NDC1 [Polypterus senegalus]